MPLFPCYFVGSFPKPSYLKIPSWFDTEKKCFSAREYSEYQQQHNNQQNQERLHRAFKAVIAEQVNLGGDIITDGEIDRENYIWHFCRFCLNGFDFDSLKHVVARNGATQMEMPRIISKVTLKRESLDLMGTQWTRLQSECTVPIKIAIPGPMTIMDSTHNEFYKHDVQRLLLDLADCINAYLLNLTNNFNVRYIQIDEPIFARKPEMARDIGFAAMKRVWRNVPRSIYKSVHLCCGYTNKVDDVYVKANHHSYVRLAEYGMDDYLVDECGVNAISIEDAHRPVPMVFYQQIRKLDIILGVIKVCVSDCVSPEQIVQRVTRIIKEGKMRPSQILLAPDCGLAMLNLDLVRQKTRNMVLAAQMLRARYQSKL